MPFARGCILLCINRNGNPSAKNGRQPGYRLIVCAAHCPLACQANPFLLAIAIYGSSLAHARLAQQVFSNLQSTVPKRLLITSHRPPSTPLLLKTMSRFNMPTEVAFKELSQLTQSPSDNTLHPIKHSFSHWLKVLIFIPPVSWASAGSRLLNLEELPIG